MKSIGIPGVDGRESVDLTSDEPAVADSGRSDGLVRGHHCRGQLSRREGSSGENKRRGLDDSNVAKTTSEPAGRDRPQPLQCKRSR